MQFEHDHNQESKAGWLQRALFPLLEGSPALGEADNDACNALNPRVDQRGVARPAGACDIGAYEGFIVPSSCGGEGGDGGDHVVGPTPAPTSTPGCVASGYRVKANYGLHSGLQFKRVGTKAIGDQSVLNAGVKDAVDVFGYVEQGVDVCFPGAGKLLFLDAAGSPRAPIATAAPAGYRTLFGCMVMTKALMRFRDAPTGAPLQYTDPWGRQENGWLPGSVRLTALERTAGWFKVDYYATQGWVSAYYVIARGNCW